MKTHLLTFAVALLALFGIAPNAHAAWLQGEAQPITGDTGGATWTEIVVTLHANGAPSHGTLELHEVVDKEERLLSSSDVDVTAPSTRFQIPVLSGRTYRVRFVDPRHVTTWESVVAPRGSGARRLVFYLQSEPRPAFGQDYDYVRTVVPLAALPRSQWTYDGAEVLFLSSQSFATIEPAACDPLVEWIRSGGALAVIDSDDETTTAGACGLTIRHEGVAFGSGHVVRGKKSLLVEPERLEELYMLAGGRGIDPYPRVSFIGHPNHAPRIAVAGILLAALAVVVGPGFFLYARRRKKAAQLFPALAVVSVGGLFAMVAIGCAFAPKAHTTTSSLRTFTSGEVRGRITQARVFHSPSGPIYVTRALEHSLLGDDVYDARAVYRVDTDGTIVLNEHRPRATDYVYLVESATDRLAAPIALSCSASACTIENKSGIVLEHARLYIEGRGFFDIGSVAAAPQTVSFVDRSDPYPGSWDVPAEAFVQRSAGRVGFVGWQSTDPSSSVAIAVTCTTGCEAAR
jgi:hypothetical protein